jgi:RadC-like JAB domain
MRFGSQGPSAPADPDLYLSARGGQGIAGAECCGGDPGPQPSVGAAEPSRADEFLTQTLKTALALVDVRVLNQLVVAGTDTVSMAERGLI